MTGWQDQAPLTRRQVRMNERGALADAPLSLAQTQTGLSPFDGFPPETTDEARALEESRDEALHHRFDTSAAAEVAAAAPSVSGGRRASRPVEAPATGEDQQAWRPRDYRPRDGGVDSRGQSFSVTDAVPENPVASGEAPQPPAAATLTRRELRALEAARAAAAPTTNSLPAPPPSDLATGSVTAAPLYELSPPPSQQASALSFLTPPDPQTGPISQQQMQPEVHYPAPTAPSLADLPAPAPAFADLPAPAASELQDLPAPTSDEAVSQSPAPQFSLAQYPAPAMPLQPAPANGSERGVDQAPQFFTAPLGHWTTQEALDDVHQVSSSALARDVSTSTGPITSSALVLPSIPLGSDFSVPFGTTGEVLITGSISLPSTMGTTGAHPTRYDHSDLDAIIDAVDRDDIEGDSAPVRAIRAVSTHTSPRDVISHSSKSASSRLPIVLAVTAGAMMVSVTVLVVVGFMFDTF